MEPKYKVNPLTGELQEYVFEYNGILALGNFTARVEDERLILHAADDVNFSILEALVSEVEINGVVYDNPTAAQEALTRLTFNRNTPMLLTREQRTLILNAVQKVVGKGLSANDFTDEHKKKLEDLQPVDVSGKVDKEEGKGLSSNDYTNTDKENLAKALKGVVGRFSMSNYYNGDIKIILYALDGTTLGDETIHLSQVYATKEEVDRKINELKIHYNL